jgi:anti-sigma regulatory factor (Ser/Thr protein kinase)
MDEKILFNLSLDHWPAILLSFIPAMITLACILYMYFRLPAYRIHNLYVLFLVSAFIWQVNDSFSRMSVTMETARAWDRLLIVGWMMIVPSTIHFAMLFTGRSGLSSSKGFVLMLYLSAYFFIVTLGSGLFNQDFIYNSYWGWVKTFNINEPWQLLPVLYVLAGFMVMVFLYGTFAYKNRHSSDLKLFSLLIFLTYFIPGLQGAITQFFFPLLGLEPVPITSTSMLTIVLVITGLSIYKKFNLSETINAEDIVEIIQEIVFVVSLNRQITYINSFGANATGVNANKKSELHDLFHGSAESFRAFNRQVLIPAFQNKSPCSFQMVMKDEMSRQFYLDINAYPIFNKKNMDGLLLICRDVTDHVHISEARLTALRSQMNPHFIFNSLNSIQHYVHNNKREFAETFLSTFSTLIGKILENSTRAFVPLSNELDTIKLYLDLEKARFGRRLAYEILVDKNLNIEDSEVPSMLIQPYIENAIIHGIANKEDGGRVVIHFKKVNQAVLCIVEDDGVGRDESSKMKHRSGVRSKSYGMSITQARLELLNQHLNIPVSVNVTNIINNHNQVNGTQVEILIPVIKQ